MTTERQLSGPRTIRTYIPGQGTAGTADEFLIAVAGAPMKITAVKFIAKAAVTHNATNFYTHTLRNRKADASGTAVPASRSLAATDIVAFVPDTGFVLSATAADLLVATGDVLTSEKIVSASGLAMPAGILEVTYLPQ